MINLLLPIAGDARRFQEIGCNTPKPRIPVNDSTILELSLGSLIIPENCRLHFVVRREHQLEDWLRELYGTDVNIIVLDEPTDGTLSTCLKAKQFIDSDEPLFIYTPDIVHDKVRLADIELYCEDGNILVFKANSPDHSYALVNDEGYVTRTAEKEVISEHAAVGLYYFKRGRDFVRAAEKMHELDIRTNGEFYLCPVYNLLIEEGQFVTTTQIEMVHVLGTPRDLWFYLNFVVRDVYNIVLCSDHSGYELKEKARQLLENDHNVVDLGCDSNQACDHHDFLKDVFQVDVSNPTIICFCETGQAFNIALNKIPGIRSALTSDAFMARRAVEHNAVQAFCIPAKYVDAAQLEFILTAIRNAEFMGGRHTTRIMKFIEDDEFYI